MIFTFVPALEADLPQLLLLTRTASHYPDSHWNDEYPAEENLREDLALGALYRILDETGAFAGMISMGPPQETTELSFPSPDPIPCEIARLALVPELMGQGHGHEVFSQAVAHGISMGYRTFRLLVVTDFLRGIRIYEKYGFRRVGKSDLWENEYYLYEYSCPGQNDSPKM